MEHQRKRFTNAELMRLQREADAALRKIPGVAGVGFGAKESGGKLTGEIALRVYVKEKKDKAHLAPEEIIPAEFNGFKTDVLVVAESRPQACNDINHYDPIIGGIGISNLNIEDGNIGIGTLGCLATINGDTSRNHIALLTNHHVIVQKGGTGEGEIYQPQFTMVNGTAHWEENDKHPIGHVLDAGIRNNYNYQYPPSLREEGETQTQYFVDCASVKVATCYSTCCHTNCGVHYSERNEINNLRYNDTDGNNFVKGIDRVKHSDIMDDSTTPPRFKEYPVWKVGQRTGRTKGLIVDVAIPNLIISSETPGGNSFTGLNAIQILATEAESCNPSLTFSQEGDSGSVIVNKDGNVVALLFGGNPADIKETHASHIHPVLDRLNITLITDKAPADPQNRSIASAPLASVHAGRARAEALKTKLLASKRGQEIYTEAEALREEVVWLVNRKRPVTVAWHRGKGPAFTAYFMNHAADPHFKIPKEIEGASVYHLLASMKEVLKQHGSRTLRKKIAQYEDVVMELAVTCESLDEFIEKLTGREVSA